MYAVPFGIAIGVCFSKTMAELSSAPMLALFREEAPWPHRPPLWLPYNATAQPLQAFERACTEDQRSCSQIIHGLSTPAVPEAKTGEREPDLREEIQDGFQESEAYEQIGRDAPPKGKARMPALTQWRAEVEAISRRLSDDAIEQLGRATAKMSGAVHYHTLDLTAGLFAGK